MSETAAGAADGVAGETAAGTEAPRVVSKGAAGATAGVMGEAVARVSVHAAGWPFCMAAARAVAPFLPVQ